MWAMVAVWILSFVLAFGLITWRDIAAPRTPSPDYPDIFRGKDDAIYYVPRWFTPLFLLCLLTAGGLCMAMPAVQFLYMIMQVKKKLSEDKPTGYSPPSGP